MTDTPETGPEMTELAAIGKQLAAMDHLISRRNQLFVELRSMTPPVKIRDIAEAAQTTEGAVNQALRRAKL